MDQCTFLALSVRESISMYIIEKANRRTITPIEE